MLSSASVIVQEMVDAAAAGVAFACDMETGSRRGVSISAVYGLGEGLVSGLLDADTYYVQDDGQIRSRIADKREMLVDTDGDSRRTLAPEAAHAAVLSEAQIRELADMVRAISNRFGRIQDVEWAFDRGGSLKILQTRPVTGSTGQPKAAKRTHGFLLEQHRVLTKEMTLPPDSVDLATLPIFALNNLACGLTTVIPSFDMRRPGDVDGAKILTEAERYGATTVTASPAFLECLMRAMTPGRVPTLRSVFTGGAAIDPPFARRLLDTFPGREITAIYGSTEAEPIASLPMPFLADCEDISRGLPAGRPIDEISLAILPLGVEIQPTYTPEEWDALRVKDGGIGEICVAGPHVLREYYHNPQAERENKIHVGDAVYHRTGDAGRQDGSGMLYLCGRTSTLFRDASGELVCPMILESLLKTLHGIRAGTILRTDSGVVACLETDLPEADAEKLLRENSVPFDRLVRLDHIPRDPRHNSKLDYGALRRLV